MRYHRIPDETVRRLPLYLRGVLSLSNQGHQSICSKNLADYVGVNSWQIRKDFSYFGDFGVPGVGYDTNKLLKAINKILKLNSGHEAVLVGVGNLGNALLTYQGFKKYGFHITMAFDNDPEKIGKNVEGLIVQDVSQIKNIEQKNVRIGILAVSEQAAQQAADTLIDAGVKGILNFSPQRMIVPKKVKVITIDIAMDLARLPYYVPAD